MRIFWPEKLYQRKYLETTWIFSSGKICQRKREQTAWTFRPLKLHGQSTRKWRGNSSKFILRRIDVISTINRRGFDLVCSLGYWNEYKAKSDNKHTENEFRYFFKTNFAGVTGVFVLIYSNQDLVSQKFKTRRSYLPKSIIKVYNAIINRKKCMTKKLIQI